MKRLIAALALTLAACSSEPTIYDQVYRDYPAAQDWYTETDIDEQTVFACDLVQQTGGTGPEWQAAIAGVWAQIPHTRQAEVFGDDPAQVVTYFGVLVTHGCPR